jgi:arsenite methyltransferase
VFRLLVPSGRIGISDVVAEDQLTPAERAERGSYVGCIAGALSRSEYIVGLAALGFDSLSVRFTQQVADGMHNAIIQAVKPGGDPTVQTAGAQDVVIQTSAAAQPESAACCDHATSTACCSTDAKASCCGDTAAGLPANCGCR